MATTPQKLPAATAPTATKTVAQAKAEAAAAKAAQDKQIAAQVAAAAAAKAKQQADAAAAKKAADAKAAQEKDLLSKISQAQSKSQLQGYLDQAKQAGIAVPQAILTEANASVVKGEAAEKVRQDEANAKANAERKAFADRVAAENAAKQAALDRQAAAQKEEAQKAALQNAIRQQNAPIINQANADFSRALKEGKFTQKQVDEYSDRIKSLGGDSNADKLITEARQVIKQNLSNEITQNYGKLTKEMVADIAARSKSNGTPLDQRVIDSANAQAQKNLDETWRLKLIGSKTQDELNKAVGDAKAAGATVDPGWVNQTKTVIQNTQQREATAAQQKLDATWNDKIYNARTQADLNKAVADAKAAGAQVNQYRVDQAQNIVNQYNKMADWAKAQTPKEELTQILHDSQFFYNVSSDPVTGQKAALYQDMGNGFQKVGADGRPSGDLISYDKFNQQVNQVRNNTNSYLLQKQTEQKEQAAAALTKSTADFEKALPSFADFYKSGRTVMRGPDGSEYYPSIKDYRTGEQHWIKQTEKDSQLSMTNLDTGKTQSAGEFYKNQKAIEGTNTQYFADQRAQQIADQNKGDSVMDFLGKALGIVGVVAIGGALFEALGTAAGSLGTSAGEAAATAGGMADAGATASEIASALEATGIPAEAATAAAETATGITSGAINPVATINELNAAQTAELMKGIDPRLINALAPAEAGAAGGTASSIFSGSSLNPITNLLTNVGVTNPVAIGALTGAGTTAAVNLITGKPITGKDLLTGAIGGGVAGGIGTVLPNPGNSILNAALNGLATNVGATTIVSLVTGRPITVQNLAGAALVGGTLGGAIHAYGLANGGTTYTFDDGSSITVDKSGAPISVTDNTGARVPVAGVDTRTGSSRTLAPVETATPIPVEKIPTSFEPGGGAANLTSTGISDSAPGTIFNGPNGPEIVLDSGKTVNLVEYQNALASGQTVSVDGQTTAALPQNAQNAINDAAKKYFDGKITWEQASGQINDVIKEQIDSGYLKDEGNGVYVDPTGIRYQFNESTGMWDTAETGTGTGISKETVEPTTPDGSNGTITPIEPPPVDTGTPPPVEPPPIQTPIDTGGGGGTITPVQPPLDLPPVDLVPRVVPPPIQTPIDTGGGGGTITPIEPPPVDTGGGGGTITPIEPPPVDTGGGGPGIGPIDTGGGGGPGIGPIQPPPVIEPPVQPPPVIEPPVQPPPVVEPPVKPPPVQPPPVVEPPVQPPPVVEPPVQPPPVVEPPVQPPPVVEPPVKPPPVVEPPVQPPPYVAPPIYVPPIEPPPVKPPTYGPITPLEWGKLGPLPTGGLNPGWITDVPQQYAPSGVRAQYYWGQHPYQPGPTFNRELYTQVPAPVTPWGLQEMYTPTDINRFVAEMQARNVAAAAPAPVPAPIIPTKV